MTPERDIQKQEPLEGFTYVVSPGTDTSTGVMLLHGTGGDEYDLLDLGTVTAPGTTLISPRGRAPENGMNRWFSRHAAGVLDEEDIRRRALELSRFIPAARNRHGISTDGLWALGFSNGANMAAAMLLLYPNAFSGAILMRPMLPLKPDTLPDISGLPVYVAAGTRDTMIPGESTRELLTLLERCGADLTVTWADRGHQFGTDEVDDVRQWFAGKTETSG